MKKIKLFVLSLIIFIGFIDYVSAEEINATLSITGTKRPGSDITIKVVTNNITEINNIQSYNISLNVDNSLIFKSCTGYENQPLDAPTTTDNILLSANTTLLTCVYKIPTDKEVGSIIPISFNNSTLTKADETVIDVIETQNIIVERLLSSVATLNNLTISNGLLVPNFSKSIYAYTVNVSDIETITISATKTDPKATVAGTGVKTLNYGINTFNIIVTAENKTVKKYVVTVIRNDERSTDTSLNSLVILNGELKPKFSSTIKEYEVTVSNDVTSLDIEATSSSKGTINITGNNDLKIGENIVIIKVTAENGDSSEYKLIVNKKEKDSPKVPVKEEKNKKQEPSKPKKDNSGILYITMAGTLVLLICAGIFILRMKDNEKN